MRVYILGNIFAYIQTDRHIYTSCILTYIERYIHMYILRNIHRNIYTFIDTYIRA